MANRIRVVVTKVGLDGHDRGAKVVASSLRDAGMEVIYAGLRQTPDTIVETAIQEDVHVIGVSIHSGAHMTLLPRILNLLKERGTEHILVVGGGIFPPEDTAALKKMGIAEIFSPGATTQSIVDYIRSAVGESEGASANPS